MKKHFHAERLLVWKVLAFSSIVLAWTYVPASAQNKSGAKVVVTEKAPVSAKKTASRNPQIATANEKNIPPDNKPTVSEPPKTPLLLALNPHFDQNVARNKQGPVAVISTPTLQSAQNTETTTLQGAEFLPLVKQTYNPADPLNKGSFIDKHEFGIQLRSPF